MRRSRRPRTSLPLAAVLLLAACSWWPLRAREPSALPAPVMVRVENHYHSEVTISVLAGGQTSRLGTVAAASGASWVLPEHLRAMRGEIRLVADPLGAPGRLVSQGIHLTDGAQIVWTLESQLQRSSIAVY